MKFSIYKIITRCGHSYVGMTKNLPQRISRHRYFMSKGKLGYRPIKSTDEFFVETLAMCDDLETARVLESRYIALNVIENPYKHCNVQLGRSNSY
jgi:predicted GIY-YIG superfamily endonuclease